MEGQSVSIGIDDEVWKAMKAEAEPLVDTPNSVLRRKFGLPPTGGGRATDENGGEWEPSDHRPSRRQRASRRSSSNGKAAARTRAPRGSLLPGKAYELPILQVLQQRGGRAAAREVIEDVGGLVEETLTPLDRDELETGGLRWHKRVQFTRLRLVERGLVKKDSPRGVWEITDEGRRALTADAHAASSREGQ